MVKIITTAVGLQVEGSPFIRSLEHVSPPGEVELAVIRRTQKYEPHIERLFVALDIVKTMATDDKIILTDFRDVLFQRDPNELDFDVPGIYFESGLYRDEPYNTHWITRDYGESFYNKLRNKRITCCGVVSGRKPFIKEYLQFCVKELEHLPFIEHGADTSVHAKYVYGQWESNAYPLSLDVYTVGLLPSIRCSRGKIVYEDGTVPVMVHQYDRHLP